MKTANLKSSLLSLDCVLSAHADRTVVGWGRNDSGQVSIPGGLGDVLAIAGRRFHSLAVKSNGIVVGWGLIIRSSDNSKRPEQRRRRGGRSPQFGTEE